MNRRKLGRRLEHYNALMRNLCQSLIIHGGIRTTDQKAKELRRHVEPLITLAKKRRLDSVNSLKYEREIRKKLYSTTGVLSKLYSIAEAMSDRSGGYTSIKKVGHRANDNGIISYISIVGKSKEEPTITE